MQDKFSLTLFVGSLIVFVFSIDKVISMDTSTTGGRHQLRSYARPGPEGERGREALLGGRPDPRKEPRSFTRSDLIKIRVCPDMPGEPFCIVKNVGVKGNERQEQVAGQIISHEFWEEGPDGQPPILTTLRFPESALWLTCQAACPNCTKFPSPLRWQDTPQGAIIREKHWKWKESYWTVSIGDGESPGEFTAEEKKAQNPGGCNVL